VIRARLYREYKLCRLLLRPLDDHRTSDAGDSASQRGSSRQTTTGANTSSLSSSDDDDDDDDDDGDGDARSGGNDTAFVNLPIYHSVGNAYNRRRRIYEPVMLKSQGQTGLETQKFGLGLGLGLETLWPRP